MVGWGVLYMKLLSSIWGSSYKFKAHLSTENCAAVVVMSGTNVSSMKRHEGAGVERIARDNEYKFEPLIPNSAQPPTTSFLHFTKTPILSIRFY